MTIKSGRRLCRLLLPLIMAVTIFAGCTDKGDNGMKEEMSKEYWVTTWGSAAFALDLEYYPTKPSLKENTLRQVAHISLGGDKFTFTFSNEYGSSPLTFEKVYVSKLAEAGNCGIYADSNAVLTFNGGSESVTIEPGASVTSDPVAFSCEALSNVAVSIEFGNDVPVKITGHSFANASCWIAEGKCGGEEVLDTAKTLDCQYFLTKINVWTDNGAGAVVCLGDSITDGVGSDYNRFNDYPSLLAELFQSDSATSSLAVVNEGIGGNKLADNACVGPCGLDRFERDVLSIDGIKYALIFIGTNDIGGANESTVQSMMAGYEKIAADCHAKGIKVYAATITPLKKSDYDSDSHRQILRELNAYLKSDDSVFDGVIDFYAAVEDTENPETVAEEYNCPWGDYLHLGAKGYEKLAEAAYDFFKESVI